MALGIIILRRRFKNDRLSLFGSELDRLTGDRHRIFGVRVKQVQDELLGVRLQDQFRVVLVISQLNQMAAVRWFVMVAVLIGVLFSMISVLGGDSLIVLRPGAAGKTEHRDGQPGACVLDNGRQSIDRWQNHVTPFQSVCKKKAAGNVVCRLSHCERAEISRQRCPSPAEGERFINLGRVAEAHRRAEAPDLLSTGLRPVRPRYPALPQVERLVGSG